MFTLRCTGRLLKRLGERPGQDVAPTTTRLGDWYANVIVRCPAHVVLCVSERTLLPLVIAASPANSIGARLGTTLAEVLRALDVPKASIETELREMSAHRIDKTASKQVLGSMNDFAFMLETHLDRGDSLLQASLRLADAPCSPIKMERPRDVTRDLLAVSRAHLRLV